ncbi:uncharacterized protein [Porites lutea]|uniref:uncharacterized protein n=1 Tax=Porites lutea TaxID=51062 RepID=UPI003CC6B68B
MTALQPFSDEQLNFFKFSSLVLNEFPKALRQTFKTMWDNTYGHRPGFQLWDDSTTVRKMFDSEEAKSGKKTKVPVLQSYNEWDCTNLFQATIFARSFAQPASTGPFTTLSDLYVKPRAVPYGSYHACVVSPGGNMVETFALAIDQLRLLRNSLCHSTSSEMDKATFDQRVNYARDAFQALGVPTASIDALGSLTESDFPTNKVRKLEARIRDETRAYIKCLEEVSSDVSELKALLNSIKQTKEEDTANIVLMLEQKINALREAQDQRDATNTQQYTMILESVSSHISDLRNMSSAMKQAADNTATKHNIAMLKAQEGLESVSADIDVLKQKVEVNTASKEDITRLEKKIEELKVVQNERYYQPNNSDIKPIRAPLPSMVPNFTGRQSEVEEIIGHVTSESTRLVSIWGSPGFGKTSVTIAVGHALQSQGLPVYWVSLRGLQSKADLTSKFLRLLRQPTINNQPSDQRLSPDDEISQLFSEISKQSVFILDNADDLLESGCQKVKKEVMQLLEEILRQNPRVTFIVTTRESLEFMNNHFQGHQGVRIRTLDKASTQSLIHELLPIASAADCTEVAHICGHVPLAIKLMCSLISEDNSLPSQIIDDFKASSTESIGSMLDIFDSYFQRLTALEQEALISLSILPENFTTEVAAAVLGTKSGFEAITMLQNLRRKSLIDSGSKPRTFTMHKLLQSSSREKGDTDMKEAILNAKGRLNAFYVSYFDKLNKEFLTGHSMDAYIAFYEDKESIIESLVEGCLDSKTADTVFDILVKGELFLDSLFWTESEAKNFDDIYDAAIKAANLHGNEKYHRQLLISKAFAKATWGREGKTNQLLSEVKVLQAASCLVSNQEKGKCFCYSGICYLTAEETKSGVHCLQQALSSLETCNDQESLFLKFLILQILVCYYQSLNDFYNASYYYDKSLHLSAAVGNCKLLIITPMKGKAQKTTNEMQFEKDSNILLNQPFEFQFVCLLSEATKLFPAIRTKQNTSHLVLQMLECVEKDVTPSTGLLTFHTAVVELLWNLNSEDPEKLFRSRINYHEKKLKQSQETFPTSHDFGGYGQIQIKALVDCYLNLGIVYNNRGIYSEALQSCKRALNTATSSFEKEHKSTADSYSYSAALRSHQHALAIRIKLFGKEHESTADSYRQLGVTQNKMHDYSAALLSHQHALAIGIELFGEKHKSIAESYRQLGITQFNMHDYSAALQSHQRALAIRIKLFGEEHESTADSYRQLGVIQNQMHDYSAALQSHQRALAVRVKLFGEEHESTADSYRQLGITQFNMHDYSAALQSHQRALAIRIKLFGEEHESTADSYRQLGVIQNQMHDYSAALQSHQRALAVRVKLFGEEHESTADSYRQLGVTQFNMHDYNAALKSLEHELAIRVKLFGEEHESTADSYRQLGVIQNQMHDYSAALQSHQRALAVRVKLFGEEHESTADSYRQLGVTQFNMHDYKAALKSLEHELAIRVKLFGEEHESTADSYRQLCVIQNQMHDYSAALQSHQRALAIRIKLFGEEHESTAESYRELGVTQNNMNDYRAALQSHQRALAIRIKLFGEEHESTADSYRQLGVIQHNMHDYNAALQSEQHVLAIRIKLFGEEHESTADSYKQLGVIQHNMHDYNTALQSEQHVLAIRIKLFGEEHESTADSYRELGVTQYNMHDYSAALQSHQRALAIRLKLFGEEHAKTADSYRQVKITQEAQRKFREVKRTKRKCVIA